MQRLATLQLLFFVLIAVHFYFSREPIHHHGPSRLFLLYFLDIIFNMYVLFINLRNSPPPPPPTALSNRSLYVVVIHVWELSNSSYFLAWCITVFHLLQSTWESSAKLFLQILRCRRAGIFYIKHNELN